MCHKEPVIHIKNARHVVGRTGALSDRVGSFWGGSNQPNSSHFVFVPWGWANMTDRWRQGQEKEEHQEGGLWRKMTVGVCICAWISHFGSDLWAKVLPLGSYEPMSCHSLNLILYIKWPNKRWMSASAPTIRNTLFSLPAASFISLFLLEMAPLTNAVPDELPNISSQPSNLCIKLTIWLTLQQFYR